MWYQTKTTAVSKIFKIIDGVVNIAADCSHSVHIVEVIDK